MLCVGFGAAAWAVRLLVTRKLQSQFGAVLMIHAAAFLATISIAGGIRVRAALVFWLGMFTLWCGVNSHCESSILLWMLTFLRQGPSNGAEVLAQYQRHYGQAARLDELVQAGFIVRTSDGIAATRKGRMAARIALLMR